MYTPVNKSKENSFPTNMQESRAVANSVAQKKNNGKQSFGFIDNRPKATAQMKLTKMINSRVLIQPSCKSLKQSNANKVVQRVTMVTDQNMDKVAADVTNSDQNTVAITKESDNYYWYSQHNIGSQKAYTQREYPNLSIGYEGDVSKGVHAEMLAIDQTAGAINRIAASRPICNRCKKALAELNITRVNDGTTFTGDWVAPSHFIDIDITNNFPAIARESNGAGTTGSRWVRKASTNIQVAKSVWNSEGSRSW
jgi:hypothetical protein